MKALTIRQFKDWFDSLAGDYQFDVNQPLTKGFFEGEIKKLKVNLDNLFYIECVAGLIKDEHSKKDILVGLVFESINQMMDFIELEDEFNQTYLINCAGDHLSKRQLLNQKEFIRVYEKM